MLPSATVASKSPMITGASLIAVIVIVSMAALLSDVSAPTVSDATTVIIRLPKGLFDELLYCTDLSTDSQLASDISPVSLLMVSKPVFES